jgi:NADH-quinone oxidoreductase subunit D
VFIRVPSFGNLQGMPAMVEGRLVSDAIAVMGSTDFVLGDIDR